MTGGFVFYRKIIWQVMRSVFQQGALFVLLSTWAVVVLGSEPERKTVCTISINSDAEAKFFQKKLSKNKFEFRELVPRSGINPQWFYQACRNLKAEKKSCDLLIVSGHYGGAFFGSSNHRLSLDQMEEFSCHTACPEIMHAPAEVFLFGCNTLSSKQNDLRSPEQYRNVLRSEVDRHGRRIFSEDQIEEVVASRYSAFGESNHDRMQRVFHNVPLIYGFHSISPSGVNATPSIRRYLKDIPDYAGHVDRLLALKKTTGQRAGQGLKKPDNPAIKKAFKVTNFAQTSGLGVSESDEFCALFDESQSVSKRLLGLERLLNKDDAAQYFNVARRFLNRYPPENYGAEQLTADIFSRIRANKDLQRQYQHSLDQLTNLPGLSLNLNELGEQLGYSSRAEAVQRKRDMLVALLNANTLAAKDLICSRDAWPSLKAEQLSDKVFKTAVGIDALACLQQAPTGLAASPYREYIVVLLDSKQTRIQQTALWLIGMSKIDDPSIQHQLLDGLSSTSAPKRILSAWALRQGDTLSAATLDKLLLVYPDLDKATRREVALLFAAEQQRARQATDVFKGEGTGKQLAQLRKATIDMPDKISSTILTPLTDNKTTKITKQSTEPAEKPGFLDYWFGPNEEQPNPNPKPDNKPAEIALNCPTGFKSGQASNSGTGIDKSNREYNRGQASKFGTGTLPAEASAGASSGTGTRSQIGTGIKSDRGQASSSGTGTYPDEGQALCRTSKQAVFSRYYSEANQRLGWLDSATNIVWYAEEKQNFSQYEAEWFCGSLTGAELPSAHLLDAVVARGFDELLDDFAERWIWSSAINGLNPLYGSGLNGSNSEFQQVQRSFSSPRATVVCAQQL